MHFAQLVSVQSAEAFTFRCDDTDELVEAVTESEHVALFEPYIKAWVSSVSDPIGVVAPHVPVEIKDGRWVFSPTLDDFS